MTRRDAICLTMACALAGALAPADAALWLHVWPPPEVLIAQMIGGGIGAGVVMGLGCWCALLIDPPER